MEPGAPDLDAVTELIEEVARTAILPRFRRLSLEDVKRKATAADPDDIVTVVDRQVEEELTEALVALAPSSTVIGEEAAHARPELLQSLRSSGPVWILDPIDGTKNFARGDDGFGVMLAWVVGGRVRAGWIVLPARKQTFVAAAGAGTFLNGVRVRVPPGQTTGRSRGAVHVRYMPDSLRETVVRATDSRFHAVPDGGCAAIEYTDILRGERDFAVYYRLLPWDHAASALMLCEAGGCAEHLDGTPYSVRSHDQLTVVARDAAVSSEVGAWLRARLGGFR